MLMLIAAAPIWLCSCSVQRTSVLGMLIMASYVVLIILYVILVVAAGASLTNSDVFCAAMAAFVQYLSIGYLSWMFAEVLFYCLRLRKVFEGSKFTQRYFVIACTVCCGKLFVYISKNFHF